MASQESKYDMTITLYKFKEDNRVFTFDYSRVPEIIAGDTITTAGTVACSPVGLTIASASTSGSLVQVRISGGAAGDYDVIAAPTTSSGSTLFAKEKLQVV